MLSSLSNNKFINYIKWLYLQYLLNTALYMLEPFEIRMFNSTVVLVLITWVISAYVFLPSQIMRIYQTFTNETIRKMSDSSAQVRTEDSNQSNIEDLLRQLHGQIKSSDWLEVNNSSKLENENPELIKAWKDAINAENSNEKN
ncbi:unnamed protein product [Brachionus calyciflorus]|uniref:Uncharacterized protein n=1 Tax=Brachionus calyciflorus TaxID=104777 RepID=A0A813XQN1_9BILA|nr:unnamed protein product [Brachionus calyciflorus]